MAQRRSLVVATMLAVLLALVATVPALAYTHVNEYHLRLSRHDPVKCGKRIEIEATLRTERGRAVSGETVYFAVEQGSPGDKVAPSSAVTGRHGTASTYATLTCSDRKHKDHYDQHVIKAWVPGKAQARITLIVFDKGYDHHQDGKASERAPFGPWGGAEAVAASGLAKTCARVAASLLATREARDGLGRGVLVGVETLLTAFGRASGS